MAVGIDELCRIHQAAMEACGDAPNELGHAAAQRLKRHLETAALWGLEAGPLEALAVTVVSLLRSEAFDTGNHRTALLLAAVLLERRALPGPGDWMRVAEGMAALRYGHLAAAVRQMVALLAADPR